MKKKFGIFCIGVSGQLELIEDGYTTEYHTNKYIDELFKTRPDLKYVVLPYYSK